MSSKLSSKIEIIHAARFSTLSDDGEVFEIYVSEIEAIIDGVKKLEARIITNTKHTIPKKQQEILDKIKSENVRGFDVYEDQQDLRSLKALVRKGLVYTVAGRFRVIVKLVEV